MTQEQSSQAALRIDGLRFGYDPGCDLFERLSLQVHAGQVHALLGPSGCGKSTVLRLIAGLERPLAGSIVVSGRIVSDEKTAIPPHRRGVGIVFQDLGLFPNRSALGNVMFGLPRPRRAARLRARELLALVGIEEKADCAPGELSGGQRRRVAIARALAPEPTVMLLDEAFDGLDAQLRYEVRADVVGILRSRGIATLLVTHDESEADLVADSTTRMSP
ncbi:MAG: ATP-binding cassette domain-containing protein [Planctomycetota bacterium]